MRPSLRFHSPLIEPDVRIARIRLSDWLHLEAHDGRLPWSLRSRTTPSFHDVAFIARGAHGDAIRRNGLRIESALGDLHLKDVKVTDDPKQVGTVDVVLFAVKLWDTEPAGEQARALVGSYTRVITFQNGVD